MTFLELAEKVLDEAHHPLSVSEIWEIAGQKGYIEQLNTKGKTPMATLYAQIYVNVKDSDNSIFAVTDSKPKRFLLKKNPEPGSTESNFDDQSDAKPFPKNKHSNKFDYLEKDLHPFLSYYAYIFQRCYTKTINHSKSLKKAFGEWVHPDIVGCVFPIDEWKTEVLEFSSAIGNISTKIFSYEIKRELNFGNLRESFFQTVSNSSWANEGYLAASVISKDEDFMSELTRLSASFGIGIIKIDIQDPDATEIILPAKQKDNLDWETINKLSMNKDFSDFLKRIKTDLTSREVRKEKYDKVFNTDELLKRIKI